MFCELQYQTQNKFPFLEKIKLDPVFGPLFGTGNKELVSVGVQDTVEVYWAFMRSAHAFSRQLNWTLLSAFVCNAGAIQHYAC